MGKLEGLLTDLGKGLPGLFGQTCCIHWAIYNFLTSPCILLVLLYTVSLTIQASHTLAPSDPGMEAPHVASFFHLSEGNTTFGLFIFLRNVLAIISLSDAD